MKLNKLPFILSFLAIVVLLLASPCLSNGLSLLNGKSQLDTEKAYTSEETSIFSLSDLAMIAHSMVYNDKKEYTEKDVFLPDYKVFEKNNFKYSFGRVKKFPNVAVLVFRGTVPKYISNLLADLNAKTVPVTTKSYKRCFKGCVVSAGFDGAYRELRDDVRKNVSDYVLKSNISTFYITGHSLGGAMAVLATYDLANYIKDNGKKAFDIGLVTFGAPRVGNLAFADHINTELNLVINARIKFNKDPITNVPPFKDMFHAGTNYVFTTSTSYTEGTYLKDENLRFTFKDESKPEGKNMFLDAVGKVVGVVQGVTKGVTDFVQENSIGDHMEYMKIDMGKLSEVLKKDEAKNSKKKQIAVIANTKNIAADMKNKVQANMSKNSNGKIIPPSSTNQAKVVVNNKISKELLKPSNAKSANAVVKALNIPIKKHKKK